MKKIRPIQRSARWVWPLFFTLAICTILTGVAGAVVQPPEEPQVAAAMVILPEADAEDGEPMTVYVQSAAGFFELAMEDGNVGDALDALSIDHDEDDLIVPGPHVLLEDGMRIEAVSLETRTRTEVREIEHETQKRKDDSLEKGKTKTRQKGENGSETLVYEEFYRDGELMSSSLSSRTVTKEPVEEILLIGTKVVDPYVSVSAEISLKNDNRKDRKPPKESEIKKVVQVQATAYTHTGNKTATGVMPYVGMIAVNPKQIPYGTRLYVEGYGYGIAGDTGAFRHTRRFQIDLFMDTYKECINWGRKNNVTVYILK